MSYYDDIIRFYEILRDGRSVPASIVDFEINGSSKRVTAIYTMDTARGIVKPQHWQSWSEGWNEFSDLRIERVESGTYDFYRLSEANLEHDPSDPYSVPRHYFEPRTTGADWTIATVRHDHGAIEYLLGTLESGGYVVIVRD